MATTPNLGIEKPETSQFSKEVTISDALQRLDEAGQDYVDIDCSAGGTITVTAAQFLDNFTLRLTGTPAGAFTVDVPDGKRFFGVINTTAQTATMDTVTSGTMVAVLTLARAIIQSLGTGLEEMASSTAGSAIFGRRTEVFPAGAMYYPSTQPAGAIAARESTANQVAVAYIPFDGASEERVQFGGVPFPNRWDKGVITFQVGYTHAGGQTGGLDGVAWALNAVSVADDAPWDVAFGSAITVTLDRATADEVHVTAESGNVTVAGTLGDGNTVWFQLVRNTAHASDDLDIDAELLFIRIFWNEDASIDD